MSLTLTTAEILQSIKSWNEIRNAVTSLEILQLENIFGQGDMFTFQIPEPALGNTEEPEYLHTYLGYHGGQLIFILISSLYDNEETYLLPNNGILNYITIATLESVAQSQLTATEPTNEISKEEAEFRMSQWNNNFQTWISQALSSAEGIYQIMNIPANDIIGGDQHRAHFALTSSIIGSQTMYAPDLVIENLSTNGHTTYDDTVCPIPPFGSNQNSASAFYILSQAMII